MGMRIGETPAALAGSRYGATPQRDTTPVSSRKSTPLPIPGVKDEPEVIRAGFGRGTVSLPAVAVRTLDRNLQNGRSMVPTVEELREERRQRLAEEAAQAARQQPAPQPAARINIQRDQEQARARTRELVNDMNEAAMRARQRLENDAAAPAEARASIRIANETIDFGRPTGAPTFDVRV